MNILMILTSHDRLGDTGEPTGFWLEEFAAPYYRLRDTGAEITLASPEGGQPPLDPKSADPALATAATERFADDAEARQLLAHTQVLANIDSQGFDALFYPGGHGPLWDLVEDTDSIALIEAFVAAGKPVAAVCHAPAVLCQARDSSGVPLLRGRRVTGFSDSEEAAVGLTAVVPFSLEQRLQACGAQYSKAADWDSYAVVDGLLVTGQNPASSEAVADALLALLQKA